MSDVVQSLHDEAVRKGEAGYIDPDSGLFVLTSAYLASRGRCCGSGCRHCPYAADAQDAAGRPKTARQGGDL